MRPAVDDPVLDPVVIAFAEHFARKACVASGSTELDDIRQYLLIEGWIAQNRYDASKGASLKTYIGNRMRAAVMDYWRTYQPWSRTVWARASPEQRERMPVLHLDAMPSVNSWAEYEERGFEEVETRVVLAAALDALPDRQALVLREVFLLERTGQDVAEDIGVSPSRVSQLVREACGRARRSVGTRGDV